MHPLIWDFLVIVTSLFTLVNPISSTPIFISLTENLPKNEVKNLARRGTLTAFVVLIVFALLGKYIFEIYSITTYAFRIVGGVLFFKVGFDLLHARMSRTKNTPKEEEEASQKEDFGISPLGIPMLAGPGSITAVVLFTSEQSSILGYAMTVFAIWLVLTFAYFILSNATKLFRIVGITGMRILMRLMGLILMVVAAQMMIDGIKTAFGI